MADVMGLGPEIAQWEWGEGGRFERIKQDVLNIKLQEKMKEKDDAEFSHQVCVITKKGRSSRFWLYYISHVLLNFSRTNRECCLSLFFETKK